MWVYVVTTRYNSEMNAPQVFTNRKEADNAADEYILDAVRDAYIDDGGDPNVSESKLQDWADEYGCWDGWYFWDGGYNYYEANVTEAEIKVTATDR